MSEKNYEFLLDILKVDEGKIVDDLSQYYKQVNGRYMQKSKIERTWGSVENYVNTLYWMKFIMKLQHYEMDELSTTKDFYKAYKDLGWNYDTFDFQQCQKMHQKELLRLKEINDKFDLNSELFSTSDYIEKRNNITLKQTSITRLINNYKVTDIDELIKKMYFFVYAAELCTSEIALIFGKDRLTISKVLRSFGMNVSRKEARKRIEKSGRGNHRQSLIVSKKAMLNRAIKNGVTGNNSENICRASIETHLYTFLDVNRYEFIVGLSSYAIIPPKEIDIPIIIYEKETNTYYRYAIELDGDIWHKKIKEYDIEKNNVIMKTDWKLIRIWFESKEKSKEKIEAGFRKIADDVCEIISSDMKGELEEWSVRIIDSF